MIITLKNYMTTELGAKARNLFLLQEAGVLVPPFFCVDSCFQEEEVRSCLAENFPHATSFSVRSCASMEDSDRFSFAGQFKTYLRVSVEEVCRRIRDVFEQGECPESRAYLQAHGLASDDFILMNENICQPEGITSECSGVEQKAAVKCVHEYKMHVMIQEMVEPEISGVLFTANPQGIRNESVIVCGRGSGDRVVEDRTEVTTYYYNLFDKTGYYEQDGSSPLLTAEELQELIASSRRIRELLASRLPGEADQEFDIEFAIRNHKIYYLQARPVTSFEKEAPLIILDNSNIVESYPGITLPLTQSFIRDAYYQVFRSLLLHLTGEPETVEQIDWNLRHMVDVANGRVYYRISNWYDVLLFLPFSSRLIPVWQEMMGVRDKAVSSHLQGKIRRKTRWKVAWSFLRFLRTCPREMEELDRYFQEIIQRFEALDTTAKDNKTLLKHYHSLKDMTVRRWDITLVNDMYGFLFTGLLKSRLKAKRVPDCELAANRAISSLKGLESMRPVELLQKLVLQVGEEDRWEELRSIQSNEAYYQYVRCSEDSFVRELQAYIQDFGDRNVEELKLESKTFRTDPVLLIRCILQYAESLPDGDGGDAEGRKSDCDDAAVGTQAGRGLPFDQEVSLPRLELPSDQEVPPLRLTGLAAFFARRAAVGIRNREKSRLHRGRLYGMMRSLVLQMGQNLYEQGRIGEPSDVFWLSCEEIEAAESEGTMNLTGIIAERKEEYLGYEELPAYSRLVFAGKIVHKHPRRSKKISHGEAVQNLRHSSADPFQGAQDGSCHRTGSYTGTACSPGIVEGEVLLIEKPSPLLDTKGKILVTKMTDPGWVFLIAPAKAIVSEKGSLLSHTAIISRELKKPAVAGVEHVTEYLKTGDRIRVDGDRGVVTVLQRRQEQSDLEA